MPWRRAGFVRTDFDYAVIKYGLLGDAPRSAPDLRVDRRPRNARRHERPARREVDRHDPEFERSGAHAPSASSPKRSRRPWSSGSGRSSAPRPNVSSTDIVDHCTKATPGHKTAVGGHAEILTLLAANGLDLEARPYNGYTALHGAAWFGHADAVRALPAAGANADVVGLDDRTPLKIARRGPRPRRTYRAAGSQPSRTAATLNKDGSYAFRPHTPPRAK